VFIRLSLLGRFAKDLAEVLATWQYVTVAIVVRMITAALAVRVYVGGVRNV
jgi:hypothetical protein